MKGKVSPRPGPGLRQQQRLLRAGQARAAGSLAPGLQPASAAHLFPQQSSWESSPRAALLVPPPAVAEVHWRSAAPAA